MKLKSVLRGLGLTLGGIVLLLILLGLAWLACNNRWVDAQPQPRPAALQLRQPSAPPEANVFFDLAGLFAMPDEAVLARGQAIWRGGSGVSGVSGGPGLQRRPVLAAPAGPLWTCHWHHEDCLARWTGDAAALRASLREQELLLGRCALLADDLLAGRRVFEEPVAEARAEVRKLSDQYPALPLASHVRGLGTCLRGFQMQAARAQLDADPAQRTQALARGQALSQAHLGGAQTLIAHGVAWAQAGQQLQLLVGLLLREPADAAALSAFFGPLPARVQDASTWMPAEAYVHAQVSQELSRLCGRSPELDEGGNVRALDGELALREQVSAWDRLSCSFGFMPQRTVQANDAWWLQQHQAAQAGPEAWLSAMQPPPAEFSMLSLPWRNTLGEMLLGVARPGYADYPARQAELLLSHRAAQLLLALTQQAVPLADRPSWLAGQAMSAGQRQRLQLSADGRSLKLQPWARVRSAGDAEAGRTWPLPAPPSMP